MQQNIVLRIANDSDFDFMQSILRDDSNTPEMVVIIQGRCHEENHTATKAMNTPLIDIKTFRSKYHDDSKVQISIANIL